LIGIVSYLLINFWFTRIQANKAAILALTMNRVGDMGLSIGYFALFALFGSLDYATIFSIVPFMNETALTFIGILLLTGAMAKSAQIPLHSWLPGSMEGLNGFKTILLHSYLYSLCYIYLDNSYFDINCLSILPIIYSIPKSTLQIITCNMLGDGSISLSKGGKGKYSMTMDVYSLDYLNHLNDNIYSQFTDVKIHVYLNILLSKHEGKKVTQYHFSTKNTSLIYSFTQFMI
jgi:Proton-conducting membrane transporter